MSFAKGMAQGQQMASQWVQMFQDGQQKRELADLAAAKPETSTGFTAAQGQQLEKLAKDGYKVDFDTGKNAYVATNEAGDTKTVAMQGVTDFLGNRSAGELSSQDMNAARQLAMADVVSKRDPVRGMYMQQQAQQNIHAGKRQAREEKQWAREDGLAALDKEIGAEFEAGLVGPDGQRRAPAVGDLLKNTQAKAFRYAGAGYSKESEQAIRDHYALSHIKIQTEGAERKEALQGAMASLQSGDMSAVAKFYNQYVPSGTNVTGIERGEKGGFVIQRTGVDGQPMPAHTIASDRDMQAMLLSLDDPRMLYQHSQNEFANSLRLRGEARADRGEARADRAEGRAAAAHAASMGDRARSRAEAQELRGLRGDLAAQANPNLSPVERRGYELGLLQLDGGKGGKYDFDPVKVQKTFGVTETDPLTGKEVVKRDLVKEKQFSTFMAQNPGIRNVDEGLIKFNNASARGEMPQSQGGEPKQGGEVSAQDYAETMARHGMKASEVTAELLKQKRITPEQAREREKEVAALNKPEKGDRPKREPAPSSNAAQVKGNFYSEENTQKRTQAQKDERTQQQKEEQEREEWRRQQMQNIGAAMQQMRGG